MRVASPTADSASKGHEGAAAVGAGAAGRGRLGGLVARLRRMVSAAAGRVETATEGEPGQPRGFPPGHFYSPIPSVPQIRVDEQRIFALPEAGIPAVDLNDAVQCRTLEALARFHDQMPFGDEKTEGLHYFFRNPAYSYGDATVLYAMLLHLRPRRLIEIGSGYSSCVTLDVNERLLNGGMQCTFIDPHPELLRSLITEADAQTATIIPRDDLESNDVLFVDSTHVSKIDSDVNHLFFRILPRLRPGVVVHLHDIFYPFEYPRNWIYEGRAWSELYVLRAFLQYNDAFEILYFNNYMYMMHRDALAKALPTCLKNPGGGFWMRRKGPAETPAAPG
jgi:hypothetical protein